MLWIFVILSTIVQVSALWMVDDNTTFKISDYQTLGGVLFAVNVLGFYFYHQLIYSSSNPMTDLLSAQICVEI